jgi:hypothetical protein
MLEYAENPRRTPRLPLRCQVRVELPSGAVECVTEDVGARGCQVVLPMVIARGQALRLLLAAPRADVTLRVVGRAAWVSPQEPWRVGVAYLAEELPAAARWMEEVRRRSPELAAVRNAPERVSLSATFYLGPMPRLLDLADTDLVLLGKVGHGLRLDELRSASAREWPASRQRFFALLEQGYLTLSRAGAVHPRTWSSALGEPVPTPVPSLRIVAPPARRPAPEEPPDSPAIDLIPAALGEADLGAHLQEPVVHLQQPAGAGAGWRAPATTRSPEADGLFQVAVKQIEAGQAHQALALLRRALGLAPGDVEIAGAIGRAMRLGRA